jgi:hypothetical protein
MPERDMNATSNIRDAVCIEANKVYDCCRDRDCLEN